MRFYSGLQERTPSATCVSGSCDLEAEAAWRHTAYVLKTCDSAGRAAGILAACILAIATRTAFSEPGEPATHSESAVLKMRSGPARHNCIYDAFSTSAPRVVVRTSESPCKNGVWRDVSNPPMSCVKFAWTTARTHFSNEAHFVRDCRIEGNFLHTRTHTVKALSPRSKPALNLP